MLAMKGHHLDDASGAEPGRGFEASARKRRLPGSLRAAGLAILGLISVFVGGFALFATHVSLLSTPEDPPPADAIIVLTGSSGRIEHAVYSCWIRRFRGTRPRQAALRYARGSALPRR